MSDLPANLGKHRWLRLLLAAIGLYIVLLPFWWYTLDALTLLAGTAADFVYGLFDSGVSITPRNNTISVEVIASAESGFGGEKHASALRVSTVTSGLPMLLALVLVTRADSLRAKGRALAVGLLVMIVLTIPAVLAWAKLTSLQLYDQIQRESTGGSAEGAGFFYYSFHGYAFSQPAVAVLIWVALIVLGLFKERPKHAIRVATNTARNASCPCGSGRKYKRCCGRAANS